MHALSTRRQMITAGALVAAGLAARPSGGQAAPEDGISHAAESIHQEPLFTASRKLLFSALIDARQFDKVIALSGVLQTMKQAPKPAEISPHVGGAFVLFGGYVTGRQIEIVPDGLIVQAWRAASWNPGIYSIARFELVDHGSGAKIIFDHTGFPVGAADHLAAGWYANYWDPLQKLLAS